MGVLNFSGTLHRTDAVQFDILSYEVGGENENDFDADTPDNLIQSPSRTKRKRSKSGCKSYDFRDCGVDARRRGSKHQRRKQNFCDLLQMVGDDGPSFDQDSWFYEDHITAFTELFLDETKMKVWEGFMSLPEDKQSRYLEEIETQKVSRDDTHGASSDDNLQYLLVDKKIRDMLRSKQLSNDGLLKYYEGDVISCMEEWFPSILVLNLDTAYDRMLVYAICQYMGLTSNTIKLKNSALIEIEMTSDVWKPPDILLTKHLQNDGA